jgi:small multidrug resistance family-3 protein
MVTPFDDSAIVEISYNGLYDISISIEVVRQAYGAAAYLMTSCSGDSAMMPSCLRAGRQCWPAVFCSHIETEVNMDGILLGRTLGLFAVTAVAELLGCYLPMLWLSGKGSPWLLVPATLSLAAFVWLLTLHPAASGRVYATYGAVYIAIALVWLRTVDGVVLSWTDYAGGGLALLGAAVVVMGQRAG